jgi:hypothetical protein
MAVGTLIQLCTELTLCSNDSGRLLEKICTVNFCDYDTQSYNSLYQVKLGVSILRYEGQRRVNKKAQISLEFRAKFEKRE